MMKNKIIDDKKPGEIITFGNYPQTADGSDKTPIQWRVLENSGNELLILSRYILDCKRYHNELADTMWHDSDLRKWLNNEFYNIAFGPEEKDQIITTLCTNNGENSPDTNDNVFLLSVTEVKAYTDAQDDNMRRSATGTEFAKAEKADSCRLYVYDKTIEKDYIIENGKRQGCSWWWTRTRLSGSSRAAFVGTRSSIRGYGRVNLACYGVRPAIKIRKL